MTITLDGQQLGNDKLALTNAKDWAKGQKYSWVPSKLPLMTGLVKDKHHDLHGIYEGKGWALAYNGADQAGKTAKSRSYYDCWKNSTDVGWLGP